VAVYTVVEEDYSVSVYRTAKSVCEAHANTYCLENTDFIDGEAKLATASDIAKLLRNESVRLYPIDGGDWCYKIEKQPKIL
jgi:hypothetical protein